MFKHLDKCRIVYNPLPKIDRFRNNDIYECPKCKNTVWVYLHIKQTHRFRCHECGYWFETSLNKVERVLGEV